MGGPATPQLAPPHAPEPAKPASSHVLALDAGMIVDEPHEQPSRNAPAKAASPLADPPAALPAQAAPPAKPALVAPEAAAAAASSVGALLRTLGAGRDVAAYRGGPTIEDLVREELRPLLKQWLDEQLPVMVERLVRAEIERVVGRADG